MNVAVVERGYYQLGALARLERSLLQYVLEQAVAHGFRLVGVPDLLPAHYLVRRHSLLFSSLLSITSPSYFSSLSALFLSTCPPVALSDAYSTLHYCRVEPICCWHSLHFDFKPHFSCAFHCMSHPHSPHTLPSLRTEPFQTLQLERTSAYTF